MAKTILLIGTLDTKEAEFTFVRDLILARGHKVLLMDVGVAADPAIAPDITAAEVAAAGGSNLQQLRCDNDRGAALKVMSAGAKALTESLHGDSAIDGVLSLGGSGGSSIATAAMQALPVGFPKLMVSTMASGDTSPYVGVKDITMMYSVVDVAGVNAVSSQVFSNAAAAMCGMVEQTLSAAAEKPIIAATMFGVTTPAVTRLREHLEAAGYEVLVFHATGSGGSAMEGLIRDGYVKAVADVTTTEWCDELVGGVLSAGPTRLDAAASCGLPQVVSLGALDMVNFGPRESVPQSFNDRTFYEHNATVTLMRTTADENRQLGEIIARKLNQATAATALFVPLRGVSMIDAPDQPFHDPQADEALFAALRQHVDAKTVELIEVDCHINDDEFSIAMADKLLSLIAS
jgi:uncharacterized protein (UPF0261 family)